MRKLLLLLTLLITSLFSASFDCKKASTEVEKFVCSDEELSRLDGELGKAYKELLSKANDSDRKMIRQEQKEWIKYRNEAGVDERIIKEHYRYKISELIRFIGTLNNRASMVRQAQELQKIEHYPTYAEVLENQNITLPQKSSDRDLYSKLRPANNFQLIGGTKNPICKETVALFNEEGTYKIDTNWYFENRPRPKLKPEDNDYLFWYLNNSGFIKWKYDFVPFEQSVLTFVTGIQYIEMDISGDDKNEYVYRQGAVLKSYHHQNIMIFDHKLEDNATKHWFTSKDNDKEWKSTREMDEAMRRIIYDQKSMDILFPNNSLKIARNIISREVLEYNFYQLLENDTQWNLYKTKSGAIMVLIPNEWHQIPELLVFSLHIDKLATLECVMIPKEWQ
jgi:uncharacterized protein